MSAPRNPHAVESDILGSQLNVWNEQRHKTETYTNARELRKFIAAHPGCTSIEMPEKLRGYVGFLQRKKLITHDGRSSPRRYSAKPQ